MARTLLNTNVVWVLVLVSFVGVQGNAIDIEKKCINGSAGCGSQGVDEGCRQTEVGEKCGDLTCRPDEKCEYALVKCKEGAVCTPPPPKCFPKETTPPVTEKCGNKTCEPNETCVIVLNNCLAGFTCKAPPPECYPKVGEKCGNKTCELNETCITVLIRCLEGSTCKAPPPKCVAKDPKPVNSSNPCANIYCPNGYTCQPTTSHICNGPGCRHPKCVPINPCANKTCNEGYDCKRNKTNATSAVCVPSGSCANDTCDPGYTCRSFREICRRPGCPKNPRCVPKVMCSNTNEKDTDKAQCIQDPCASVKCETGYTCEKVNITCTEATCNPVAKCVPQNPCDNITCEEGYNCVPNVNNPTVADCVRDPCTNVECQRGYTCTFVAVNCLVAPCPPSYTECVPINPCSYTSCLEGYTCVTSEDDPTVAKCVPPNPCATVLCKPGYRCESVNVQCIRAPCPPIAQCIPINPCKNTTCLEGNVCTQIENDPTVAKCVLTPCATVRCGYNTTCMSFTEYCKYAPCTPPKAKCVPRTDENPCALVDCRDGYTCENVPVSNCEEVSCPTTRAECKLRRKKPCDIYSCPNES